MGVYLQDGSYGGHALWCADAIADDVADGAIISPFFTPREKRARQATGEELADKVRDAGGDVIFDATTHGALLPGVNNWTYYDTWKLWSGARGDLSTDETRDDHIERVFGHQDSLSAARLVPTVPLDSPVGANADIALALADAGRTTDRNAWQSLAGRRGFWLSDDLDAHVGSLAQLRAPVWLVTMIWESGDYPPNLSDATLTAAMCRTIDSLSRRSRVIVCHSDFYGLPAVAAGASDVGTGWHGKQRVCAPSTYQRNEPGGVRRQAVWHTYQGLCGRLHHTFSEAVQRQDIDRARRLYPGPIETGSKALRHHHLGSIRELVESITAHDADRAGRVAELRAAYETAMGEWEHLTRSYSRTLAGEGTTQVGRPYDGLEEYALAEGIWDED